MNRMPASALVSDSAVLAADLHRTLVELVDMVGLEPGTCDIVLVVEPTSWPAFTFVRVCERLNVPPSCAWARALEFRTGPFPLFMLVPV